MHDMAREFARAVVRSKDAQKQLARTSLKATLFNILKLYKLTVLKNTKKREV